MEQNRMLRVNIPIENILKVIVNIDKADGTADDIIENITVG